jgi:outer membrane PBP1 activator LpoA protein
LHANRGTDASRVLGTITGTLSTDQATQRRILDAEVALALGQAQPAWQKITAIPEPTGTAAGLYFEARMRIALAAARPVDAVRAEISAEHLLSDSGERTQLRTTLLALLRQARERGVKLEAGASQDPTVRGWLDLGAMIGSTRGASLSSGGDAAQWRARYPGHPATELLSEALPQTLGSSNSITHVALLLPLSSSSEARNIRDGFQHALNQMPAAARPELRIYDTSTVPAVEQMATARADGCDFIIGPLLRNEVVAVAASGTPPVPVLALNFLPGETSAPAGFYQYALSPEDEARATARHILASGQRRGVALAPTGDWGNRVLGAFTQEFLAGGGVLLSQASYDPNTHDYSVPIKQVLGTTESEARLRRIQAITGGKFEFEPRRRADIDFVFAAASQSSSARLLRPQLGYQYAGQLPIYMTSMAYTPDIRESNQDLNGILFPEMPWLLPDSTLDGARQAAEQAAASNGWHTQYFAFGYDALQLALAITGSGRDTRRVLVAGLSGQLSLSANGRVQRELAWARIRDGEALLIDAAMTSN